MSTAPGSSLAMNAPCSVRSSRQDDLTPICGKPPARGRSFKSAQHSVCRSPSGHKTQPGSTRHTSSRAAAANLHGLLLRRPLFCPVGTRFVRRCPTPGSRRGSNLTTCRGDH